MEHIPCNRGVGLGDVRHYRIDARQQAFVAGVPFGAEYDALDQPGRIAAVLLVGELAAEHCPSAADNQHGEIHPMLDDEQAGRCIDGGRELTEARQRNVRTYSRYTKRPSAAGGGKPANTMVSASAWGTIAVT